MTSGAIGCVSLWMLANRSKWICTFNQKSGEVSNVSESLRHLGRDAGLTVEQTGESHPGDSEMIGKTGDTRITGS
jgi:hypothetical protein